MLAEERSAAEVAKDVGVHPKTVREVRRDFFREGLDVVFPKKRSGRPRMLDQKAEDRLIELLRRKPEEFGIESGVWTLETACNAAKTEQIVPSIGKESLRRVFGRNKLSWKRVKGWIKPSDSGYEEKKARRDRIVAQAQAHDDWDVEYTDESWLVAQPPDGVMNPQMGSCWSEVGRPARVITKNSKSSMTVPMYAGISIKDGEMYYRFTDKVNTQESKDYLAWRAEEGRKRGLRRLFIIWDNASWHTSKGLMDWLRQHNGKARKEGGTIISVVLLPKRSPWLNPIEAVFRWLKQRAIFCRIHENLDQLTQMVARCIEQRNPARQVG